jgi:hypothetical protein
VSGLKILVAQKISRIEIKPTQFERRRAILLLGVDTVFAHFR